MVFGLSYDRYRVVVGRVARVLGKKTPPSLTDSRTALYAPEKVRDNNYFPSGRFWPGRGLIRYPAPVSRNEPSS